MKLKSVVTISALEVTIKRLGITLSAESLLSESAIEQLGLSYSSETLSMSMATAIGYFIKIIELRGDLVSLADSLDLDLSKPIADEAALLEKVSLLFGVSKQDTIGLTETFANVIEYKREFNDAFTLDDAALIDKDYFANKGNVFGFSELYRSTLSKKVSNEVSFSENFVAVIEYVRTLSDSVTFAEDLVKGLSKELAESLGTGDSQVLDVGKSLSDDEVLLQTLISLHPTLHKENTTEVTDSNVISSTLGKVDEFGFADTYATTFAKFISDAFALDDFALVNKNFIGNKGNVTFVSDVFARSLQYQRLFADDFVFTDEQTFDTTLGKSDPVVMGDSLDKDTSYVKEDNYSFTDAHQVEAALRKEDNAYANDEIAKGVSQGKDDDYSVDDNSTLHPNLGKSDSFSYTDSHAYTLSKNITDDGFVLDDAALIGKNYYGTKGNIFGVTEEFANVVAFQRNFANDSIGLSSSLITNSFRKGVNNDNISVIGEPIFLVGKDIVSDTIGFDESIIVDYVPGGVSKLIGGAMINTHTIG